MTADPVVLVVGDACPDLVLRGDVVPRFGQAEQLLDAADLVLGGSAAIVACGLARLGVPTAVAAVVGDDPLGDVVRDWLSAARVDVRWLRTDPDVPTGITVVLSAEERAILTYAGTIAATGPDVVDLEVVERVRHVHSASYFLTPLLAPALVDVFAHAHRHGVSTSLDTNWDPAERWQVPGALLAETDVYLPNDTELLAVCGGSDVEAAAQVAVGHGAGVALKSGAAGGCWWGSDGSRAVTTSPRVEVVDTTGAGDSFDAGFLSAWVEGRSPAECLERAVVTGSLSTRAAGGTGAQPTRDEVDALLAARR
jgi:sugar/nucleoside kinase (ribokinase family)